LANSGGNTISVIDTTTDEVINTVSVGPNPNGMAINEGGSKVYAANSGTDSDPGNTVSAIEIQTDQGGDASFNVVATIPVTETAEASPTALGIARSNVYVASVYVIDVIDMETDTLIDTDPADPDIDPIHTGKPGPTRVAITSDGSKAYVVNSGMDTVSVIDIESDELIATVEVGSTPVDMEISPDGSMVYVANSGLQRPGGDTVSVIDTSDDQVIATVELECVDFAMEEVECTPTDIEITQDGSKAYVANSDTRDIVSVIDTSDNEVTTINLDLIGTIAGPISISIIPNMPLVYVAVDNNDGAISVIRVLQQNFNERVDEEGGPVDIGVAATEQGNLKVYVANFFGDPVASGGTVSVIDLQSSPFNLDEVIPLGSAEFVPRSAGIVATPDGSKVYVANSGSFSNPGNTVSAIDVEEDELITTVEVGSRPIISGDSSGDSDTRDPDTGFLLGFGSITPNSSKVYVANFFDNTVSIIRTSDDQVIATVPVGDAPVGIAITPDGIKAYVANSGSDTVSVINTETNEVIQTIDLSPEPLS
jgi:40-residue YVTN family beta-propeller repeat